MYITSSNAQSFTIPGGTTGVLYPPHPKGEQSVAVVELDGQYPEKGYSVNDVCTETLYVMEGELSIDTEKDIVRMTKGDLFMILPGMRYRLTGKGKVCVLITPSWDSAQNHIVEE